MDKYAYIFELSDIVKTEDLLALRDEKIDELVDIPVGFRIKLKKFVNGAQQQRQALEVKENT